MRVTYRGTRKNLSNKHNDRNFDTSKAKHIDPEREHFNVYWHAFIKDNPEMSFEESEKIAYKDLFSKYVKLQNEKHIKRRQYKRVRTTDDVWQNKNTKPEEVILQIGDMDNHPSVDVLSSCWKQLLIRLESWNSNHGNHIKVLNFAAHLDESTPHIHFRRVWVAYDKELNCNAPKQELALAQAGVPLPNPNKPKSRTNNRKITFDKMVRGWWQDICIEHGLNIETEPLCGRRHKAKEVFIDEKIQSKQAELERLTADVEIAKELLKIKERKESQGRA